MARACTRSHAEIETAAETFWEETGEVCKETGYRLKKLRVRCICGKVVGINTNAFGCRWYYPRHNRPDAKEE